MADQRVVTGHLSAARLEQALDEVIDPRDPPLPVSVRFFDEWRDGQLHGWAPNPNGTSGELRGLVTGLREYAPGFWHEFLTWATVEHIRRL